MAAKPDSGQPKEMLERQHHDLRLEYVDALASPNGQNATSRWIIPFP